MTSVTKTLTIVYAITNNSRTERLATIDDLRAMTGVTDKVANDGRVALVLEMASRQIRARAGRPNITGLVNKERLGASDGVTRGYYTLFKPLLHKDEEAGGALTNDSADVEIYTIDSVNDDSFNKVNPADYKINGTTGHIWFLHDKVQQSGKVLYISYRHSVEIVRQCEILLAAHYLFLQFANDKNQTRSRAYKEEFEQLFTQYIGEDHAFFTVPPYEEREGAG